MLPKRQSGLSKRDFGNPRLFLDFLQVSILSDNTFEVTDAFFKKNIATYLFQNAPLF